MWVQSLGWEDPLEKEMAFRKIPWTEEPGGLQSMESQKELDMTKETVCGIALEYKMPCWLSLNGTTMDMETQDVRGSINL